MGSTTAASNACHDFSASSEKAFHAGSDPRAAKEAVPPGRPAKKERLSSRARSIAGRGSAGRTAAGEGSDRAAPFRQALAAQTDSARAARASVRILRMGSALLLSAFFAPKKRALSRRREL